MKGRFNVENAVFRLFALNYQEYRDFFLQKVEEASEECCSKGWSYTGVEDVDLECLTADLYEWVIIMAHSIAHPALLISMMKSMGCYRDEEKEFADWYEKWWYLMRDAGVLIESDF